MHHGAQACREIIGGTATLGAYWGMVQPLTINASNPTNQFMLEPILD
ncbi:MAG: hypothetical protein ACHQ9S_22805 [Candidatus Binatia bacterium]